VDVVSHLSRIMSQSVQPSVTRTVTEVKVTVEIVAKVGYLILRNYVSSYEKGLASLKWRCNPSIGLNKKRRKI
jgi:hypothetical protein